MSLLTLLNPVALKANIIKILCIVVALGLSHGAVAWWSYNKAQDIMRADILENTVDQLQDHAKELAKQQASFNDSVVELNKRLSTHSQTVKIINNNVEREIEKLVYRNILVPASGMYLIADNANILNSNRVSRSTISKMSGNSNTKEE